MEMDKPAMAEEEPSTYVGRYTWSAAPSQGLIRVKRYILRAVGHTVYARGPRWPTQELLLGSVHGQ
jgi:hypothetical protein